MNRPGHINRDEVLCSLSPSAVLESVGIEFKRAGDWLRSPHCFACGARSRDSFAVHAESGRFKCHHCGAKGNDVLALVALQAGLDVKAEFPKVLVRAAEIAGVTPGEPDPARERRVAERRAADERRARDEAARRNAAVEQMPATWEALSRRSTRGESYLTEQRGIDAAALRAQGDIVRYSDRGEIAVAMRSLTTGAIMGIQYRATEGKGFRTEPYSQADGSGLIGRVTEIDPDGVDVAVIVEGLADALAAILAFPGCAVFGAPGKEHLETVAAAVAPRLVAARGRQFVVPDVDGGGGERCAARAVARAIKAGLELDRSIHLVDVRPHHDLADAWRAGWRWSWPS